MAGKGKWKWRRDKGSGRQRRRIVCVGEDDIVATAEITAAAHVSGETEKKKEKSKRKEREAVDGERERKSKRSKVIEVENKSGFDWWNTETLGKILWIKTCSIGEIGDSKVEFQGGGICVSEKGVIITASYLFDELEDEKGSPLPDGQVTRSRCFSDDGLRELECIKQYKTLGIAFARIKTLRRGDKFEYIDLPDSVTVQSLDEAVAVVHSSAPYSCMSATVCFPYTSPPSLQIPATNFSITTLKKRKINPYKSGHENPFTIRTAGQLVDPHAFDHPFYENLMQLRYDLPLIQVHQIQGTFGMEGCPLFTPIGEFLGLIIGGSDCSEFVLPVDIINAVARPVIHDS